jgi:hypothetical protein
MCRSIKVLRKRGQPATPDEVNAASLQFVRKISGFHKPPKTHQEAFQRAAAEVAAASERLLQAIELPARETDATAKLATVAAE